MSSFVAKHLAARYIDITFHLLFFKQVLTSHLQVNAFRICNVCLNRSRYRQRVHTYSGTTRTLKTGLPGVGRGLRGAPAQRPVAVGKGNTVAGARSNRADSS
jgi:hypothetical protein